MELTVAIQKRLGFFHIDADFTVNGERIGLFGPSGCGKSTLVSLIAGLLRPDLGRILVDGEEIFDSEQGVNIPVQRRRIGMVFQRPHLFPHLSVKGNLLYGYKRSNPAGRKITLDHLLEVLQIGHLLRRGVKNLSGGEKQRVAIGRAVLSNPRILIMDEPLSGLDDSLKFQIIPFLAKVCTTFEIPYLFISHSLTEMRIMADRVLRVAEGRVMGHISAEELARASAGESTSPYVNLLSLSSPRRLNGLNAYRWGGQELLISGGGDIKEALFELPSTDIILFKRHPEAISARNLLQCRVSDMFTAGKRIGVELTCGTERIVAVVTEEAMRELSISRGAEIYAAIKATAFRQLD